MNFQNKNLSAVIIGVCMIFFQNVNAQYLKGITNVRDTSFTNASAFKKTLKYFPQTTRVPELHFDNVMQKTDITYCSYGKRKMKLDIFYDKNVKKKQTAIIIIHGGGWRSGSRQQHHQMAEKLASLGYVCFTPEYRLSTEALFPAAIYDLKACIRWVRENAVKYNINPDQVTALGFSAGGELAAFMGTTANMPLFEGVATHSNFLKSQVNAVVSIDGTLSFVHSESSEGDDSKNISAGTYWFGYSRKDNPKLWEAASPLSYVNASTPPTLFINSSIARMHAGRDDYRKVLNENTIYSEVHEFENSPHSFCLFNPWFEPTIQYIDNFLTKIFST
ncbi:alpha/beta hydrolase [Flavobacterium sp. S87F.05.LMB.W.Kidney.N]|uniref:alpha/beta hydrolase n=1 Tax=Flavobacterium sp. S87F.05.LMB.W.Kidney.N TaxID=1278758 RepID=UPI0010E827C4|nr:alpha/beta hydrolase [Flavobacterium sp. S87F.05.LMB.W.Kidney.N]TDX12769.1 acetyl esterase/lipase [Flavobacterium sp. S87F.05.LMB.W.Kidney.N]